MNCPHCAESLFRSAENGAKLKARVAILVIHKSGEVEINCAACKLGVLIPLELAQGPFTLRKAAPARFVLRRT